MVASVVILANANRRYEYLWLVIFPGTNFHVTDLNTSFRNFHCHYVTLNKAHQVQFSVRALSLLGTHFYT